MNYLNQTIYIPSSGVESTLVFENNPLCSDCELIFEPSAWKALPILSIGLLSLIGNAGVIAVLLTDRSLKPIQHPSNQALFMLSLGISDFGSAFCFLLFSGRYALQGHGPNSRAELDIGAGLSYSLMTASLFSTLGIGLDKLAHIETPYRYQRVWTRNRCACLIIFYWILLATLSVLPTGLVAIPRYYYQFNKYTLTFVTRHEAKISALLFVRYLMFVSLLLTLGIGYGRLYCIMRRFAINPPSTQMSIKLPNKSTQKPFFVHNKSESNRISSFDNNVSLLDKNKPVSEIFCQNNKTAETKLVSTNGSTTDITKSRKMLKGTKTICLVLGSFLVVWLPYFIVHIAMASKHSENNQTAVNNSKIITYYTNPNLTNNKINQLSNTLHKPVWLYRLDFVLIWFAMLHTCVNVAIYSGTYQPFRRGLVNLIMSQRHKTNSRNSCGRNNSDVCKFPARTNRTLQYHNASKANQFHPSSDSNLTSPDTHKLLQPTNTNLLTKESG